MVENSTLYKVANRALVVGEDDLVFQNPETLHIIEPYEITEVIQNGLSRTPNISEDVEYILRNLQHQCYILLNDNGKNRHTLILD